MKIKANNKLPKLKGKTVEVKMKGTHIWLVGEELQSGNWNIYIECREINKRKIVKEDARTETFNILTNIAKQNALKFQYEGTNKNLTKFSNYLKKLLKKNY